VTWAPHAGPCPPKTSLPTHIAWEPLTSHSDQTHLPPTLSLPRATCKMPPPGSGTSRSRSPCQLDPSAPPPFSLSVEPNHTAKAAVLVFFLQTVRRPAPHSTDSLTASSPCSCCSRSSSLHSSSSCRAMAPGHTHTP
jgi:hypothetical protein